MYLSFILLHISLYYDNLIFFQYSLFSNARALRVGLFNLLPHMSESIFIFREQCSALIPLHLLPDLNFYLRSPVQLEWRPLQQRRAWPAMGTHEMRPQMADLRTAQHDNGSAVSRSYSVIIFFESCFPIKLLNLFMFLSYFTLSIMGRNHFRLYAYIVALSRVFNFFTLLCQK